jgi:hypothetical protein
MVAADKTKAVDFKSYPFINKECVNQENYASNGTRTYTRAEQSATDSKGKIVTASYSVNPTTVVKTPLYKDFATTQGPSSDLAKSTVGNLPVLGQYQGTFDAQSIDAIDVNGAVTPGNKNDRLQLNNFLKIWNDAELNTMYGSNTPRTGSPRWVSTGIDGVNIDKTTGKQCTAESKRENCFYYGGKCTAVNGQMAVRSKITLYDGIIDSQNLNLIKLTLYQLVEIKMKKEFLK